MKAELAGVSGRMQKAIEEQVEALSSSVAHCLDGPSPARGEAAKLVSATAALLQAMARVKGEFRYNYEIRRSDGGKPMLKNGWTGYEDELLTEAEFDALTHEEQVDYERWTLGARPRFGGWKGKRKVEVRVIDEQGNTVSWEPFRRDPLPPENRGSNDDAAKP
jgi:hypothetical protein